LLEVLGESTEKDTFTIVICNYTEGALGYSNVTLCQLEDKCQKLLQEKENREGKIKLYGAQINSLWDCLEVSQEERELFFANVEQSLRLSALDMCKAELDGLLVKKKKSWNQ